MNWKLTLTELGIGELNSIQLHVVLAASIKCLHSFSNWQNSVTWNNRVILYFTTDFSFNHNTSTHKLHIYTSCCCYCCHCYWEHSICLFPSVGKIIWALWLIKLSFLFSLHGNESAVCFNMGQTALTMVKSSTWTLKWNTREVRATHKIKNMQSE